MSARPARTAQDALREMIGAMNSSQLAVAAKSAGVSLSSLRSFAEGRSGLPSHCLHRLGEHLFAFAISILTAEVRIADFGSGRDDGVFAGPPVLQQNLASACSAGFPEPLAG